MNWGDKSILITGGTGSLGQNLVRHLLPLQPQRLIVFSRDELKQSEMQQLYPDDNNGPMRYFIGDVRDQDRLRRAMQGVDIVIHAAAMKQVPACEYNPFESVATNVIGAQNVIDAALDARVKKCLLVSTDKAVNPINTYGACKLVAEKQFIQANAYAGRTGTWFSVCRYGNVMGSRGSVIPLFFKQKQTGTVTLTDKRMTRFWITLDQAVDLVKYSLTSMAGGEVFVPKLPSMSVVDLVTAIAPDCLIALTGIRPGEKLHEALISEDEGRNTMDAGPVYVVQPVHPWWKVKREPSWCPVEDGFKYTSDCNDRWLSISELKKMIGGLGA